MRTPSTRQTTVHSARTETPSATSCYAMLTRRSRAADGPDRAVCRQCDAQFHPRELRDRPYGYARTFVTPWWDGAPSHGFPRSRIYDIVIRRNEFHHLGFRTGLDDPIGGSSSLPNRLRFEDNYVHDVAHNGVQFPIRLWLPS